VVAVVVDEVADVDLSAVGMFVGYKAAGASTVLKGRAVVASSITIAEERAARFHGKKHGRRAGGGSGGSEGTGIDRR
jgi:hypothetical protein